jgi:L-threonylcarbamoyladenylate synthase
MKIVRSVADESVARALLAGGVVVMRSDTLYGIFARADDEKAVEKIYKLKDRNQQKSPIVLISSTTQLYDEPPENTRRLCEQNWPGPVSIIVPSVSSPWWIHRGNESVAYRLPDHEQLRALIEITGPLAAPSANPEGQEPAHTIEQAIDYFGDAVDVYVDGGEVGDAQPSQLLRVDQRGNVERLR